MYCYNTRHATDYYAGLQLQIPLRKRQGDMVWNALLGGGGIPREWTVQFGQRLKNLLQDRPYYTLISELFGRTIIEKMYPTL